jgi:SPP1 family predicted phage head-tail adaptor
MKLTDVNICAIRVRAELWRKTTAPDDQGGHVDTWAKVRDIWVEQKSVSNGEKTIHGRVGYVTQYKFVSRYDASIDYQDQIRLGGAELNIVLIEDIELRHRFILITAWQGIAQ